MTARTSRMACVVVLALAACSSTAESVPSQGTAGHTVVVQPSAGNGGSIAATSGSTAGADVGAPAGRSAAIGGAPSASSSGRSAAGAAAAGPPIAGTSVAGAGTPTAGLGGASPAGAGGASGSPGSAPPDPAAADGGMAASAPSPGCAKQTPRPQAGSVTQGDRIYRFPTSYDGKTPMPLLLGLHAAGNPITQIQSLTQGSRLESNFVGVFPKSAGSAWVYNTDVAKVKAALDDVLANYCIDTSRIFATGHSSGAQMVVQMLCNGETRFQAVAPVAASKYCAKLTPVAVLYIQGRMDAQRGGGNGMDVVNVFATSNGCGAMAVPKDDVPSCMSTFDRKPVTPGCVTYPGCAKPTSWCSHDDNGYNNTDGRQHGWPCFASNAIADFFLGLP